MRPVVLFDFDGTLADSLGLIFQTVNRLAPELGIRPVKEQDLPAIRKLKTQDWLRQQGITLVELPRVMLAVRAALKEGVGDVRPFPGIFEMLVSLRVKGIPLGIVTSNSRENVEIFLEKNQLTGMFSYVDSGVSLFGKSGRLRRVARDISRESQIFYVGDETRDIEAARKNKFQAVSVSWGFHDSDLLLSLKPDLLIHTPNELSSFFE